MALFILSLERWKNGMFRLILGLILVALPLTELVLLVKTGRALGLWATLTMLVGAGILGAFVLSRQSRGALRRAAQAMEEGRPPMADALDGALLMMAGLLLITPGFLTDALALLLLIPPLRRALGRWTVRRMLQRGGLDGHTFPVDGEPADGPSPRSPHGQGKGTVIEGEFERLGEKPADPHSIKPPSTKP
jgi:UPF0716 protein FxsA